LEPLCRKLSIFHFIALAMMGECRASPCHLVSAPKFVPSHPLFGYLQVISAPSLVCSLIHAEVTESHGDIGLREQWPRGELKLTGS
jgi:hypothetical protein